MFSYTKLMQAMVAAGVVTPTDPYFNLVTLLLPGNGTNGAQNNTFLDSSSNNFTITRNGNTTQGTFSPFSQTGWSNYLDGTGDYLQTPSNSAFAFGTGDYTIEGWFYPTATTANLRLFEFSDNNDNIGANFTSTGTIGYYNGSTNTVSAGTPFTANQWNHVAIVRSSGTVTVYVNGTSALTQATTPNTTSARSVGIAGITDTYFPGYISNVRILKGTAQYTSNFTPPTSPLTAITNTQLLTCQSNRFIDNSSNAFALTVNGDTKVQAFSPFAPTAAYSAATNGGSGYFDGSGDYLSIADNAALQFSANTVFTIEAWIYPTSVASPQGIMVKRGSSGTQEWGLLISSTSTALFGANSNNLIGTTAIKANSWNHIAASSDGTTVSLYLNGARDGTATASSLGVTSSTNAVLIGYQTTTANPFTGWICDARVVKGTQLYSGTTYTVPTAPLTAVTNTSLLTSYTNAGITDATAKNDLETVGGAQISTTQSKFGGSSMYFDGTGDYLTAPASPNNNLNIGDFTLEFWVYRANLTGDVDIVGCGNVSTTGYQVRIKGTTGYVQFLVIGGATITTTTGIAATTWTHIAIVRSGTTVKIYINGTDGGGSGTVGNSGTVTTELLVVGANRYDYSNTLNGYIDDLRITKGYARYTANFTAPTAAFPVQ